VFNDVSLAGRLLDDFVEIFLRDQHAALHDIDRHFDRFAYHVLVTELLEELNVDW